MRTKGKVIRVSIGIILIGSLIALWPKRDACPLVITVSHAERVKYIGDGTVVRWVTICASNQNPSLPEIIHFGTIGIEFRVTNQWLKAEAHMSDNFGPGGSCETEVLVPAQANTLRVNLQYFQGKLVFRQNKALDWILDLTKNRIPESLWQRIDGLREPNFKRVSLDLVIPPEE